MRYSFFNFINLNNRFIFFSVIGIVVSILTYTNNYYFYNYVKIRDYQEIRTLGKTIHHRINQCDLNNNDVNQCMLNINKYLKVLSPYAEIVIYNSQTDILLEYKKIKKRHLSRIPISIPNYLKTTKNKKYRLSIIKRSMPNIFYSTIRSITFSIKDFINKIDEEDIKNAVNWYITDKIYLRSQNVVVFLILSYLLIYLIKIKQIQLSNQIYLQNRRIINLAKNLEYTKESEKELLEILEELKSNNTNIIDKMKKYDSIINPPIDLLKYEDIINLDPESIIFKCRKVLEKLVIQLHIQYIGSSEYKSLDSIIKTLRNSKVLNKKAVSYANTIKAFGNISAHTDYENHFEFTKKDAIMISNILILFIEEINGLNYK